MALATSTGSSAPKYVSVLCDGSQPRLAMLLNRTPAPGALTFVLVVRGGVVNLPMTRGNREATFSIAVVDASSQLPRLLASQEGVESQRINRVVQIETPIQGPEDGKR